MVFESMVVDLVNRYLGDFIENLDKSQLKIGIWGGDVLLNDLYVKESALDQLDLPVKVIHGNIGKLTLKIPWKNLYTAPTIAILEGLYVIAVPNTSVKYNAEKEEKAELEAKKKKLEQIEEAKKATGKDAKEEDKDGFAEKLATNVIKNLQIHISDIHIRYEDSFTNPQKPFSIGATLKNLSFETANEHWKPTIIKDAVTMIYKMVKLDSLAVYWNADSVLYTQKYGDKVQIGTNLKQNIISADHKTDYNYLIDPICSEAKLRMHTKPHKDDFKIPKILLNVIFEEISVALTRVQYQNIMELLEALERMTLSSNYRKYRPECALKGNSKAWWHFAYQCILKETVERKRKMWSWKHISEHRKLCKEYKNAYKVLLTKKKADAKTQEILDKCEKNLSVFCLTLFRQQAENECKKKPKKEESKGGWFGGFFGGKKEEPKEVKDISEQFQKLMTADEKAKLYEAIGYEESAADPTLPLDYIANKVHLQLNKLRVTLKSADPSRPITARVTLADVYTTLEQRPAANAIRVEAKMNNFTVEGSPESTGGMLPLMVTRKDTSEKDKMLSLLNLMFETNPLDGNCDQRVKVNSRPLEVIYHAPTIINVVNFFKPPESVYLKQLQQAAMSKFEELKEETATGLQFAIQQRKYTEIDVNLKPTRIILPETGIYKQDKKFILVDCGELKIGTQNQNRTDLSGNKESLKFEEMMEKAYDKFDINLKSVQVMFVHPGENWMTASAHGMSPMHILRPLDLSIILEKGILQDPKIPKVRINGTLPNLNVNMSDQKLANILRLVDSIPFPEGDKSKPSEEVLDLDAPAVENVAIEGDAMRLAQKITSDLSSDEEFYDAETGSNTQAVKPVKKKLKAQTSKEFVNATDVVLKFELREICVNLSQLKNNKEVPILKLVVENLGTQVTVRTFDLQVAAYLGGIYVQHTQLKAEHGGPLINLINTPVMDEQTFKLLSVTYTKANKKGPEFSSTYNNTEQKICVNFRALEVLLHQDAIVSILEFAECMKSVQPKPAESIEEPVVPTAATTALSLPSIMKKSSKAADEVIDIAVEAQLDVFTVSLTTKASAITEVKIQGLNTNVEVQKSKISVDASLKDISVYDPSPQALYPKILSFEGGEVFNANIVVYNGATDGANYSDMKRVDTAVEFNSGCMKIVFLNAFVNKLLGFMDKFQAAKDKVADASKAAAVQAAAAAEELSAKAPRVSLKISLKAPVIIVPQNSKSENALVADLGKITLKNSFQAIGKYQDNMPAVLDNISIELSALKLSRAKMMGLDMTAECLILEPIQVILDIQRNLSVNWYHGHPDISIVGRLPKISVNFSQGDFTMMMLLLNENLTEGAAPGPGPKPSDQVVPVEASTVSAVPGETPKAEKQDKQVSDSADVYLKMKFCFTIERVTLLLFSGDSNLDTGFSERLSSQSLGMFELQTMRVDGGIKSDTSIKAHVILTEILLRDTREGREKGITGMIERAKGKQEQMNMIDVDFVQQHDGSKDLDVKVNGLYICVCLEYLMAVADFFVKGLPKAETPPPVKQAPTSVPSTTEKPAPVADMNITLAVEKPEIVLVENAMDLETKALILQTNMLCTLRMTPEMQAISGNIMALEIFSSYYNPEKRSSKTLILNPVDIALHSSSKYNKDHHVDIIITDVIINISPATISSITATLSSLAPKQDEEAPDTVSKIPPDLWAVNTLEKFDFWFLKPGGGKESSVDDPPMVETETPEPESEDGRGEQVLLSMKKIIVTLEGGVGNRTIPLLITEMGLTAEVRDWSSKLQLGCDLRLEVAYYNELVAVWEPLIEPVEDKANHRPWELSVEVAQNDLIPIDDDVDDGQPTLPPPKMTITAKSRDVLQMTLTKTCLDVLNNLGKAFTDAYMLVETSKKEEELLAPFVVQNDTGLYMQVRIDKTLKVDESTKGGDHVDLEVGDKLNLYHSEEARKELQGKSVIKTTQEDSTKSIHVILQEFGATRELRIVKAEQRAFGINQKAYPGGVWQLIMDTKALYGCKIVTLRSMLQVHNHLPFGLEMYYRLSDSANGFCGNVKSDQTFNVPIDAVYSAPYELFFKPKDMGYGESKTAFQWKEPVSAKNSSNVVWCEPLKEGSKPIYFSVSVDINHILLESTGEKKAETYMLHLHPCVVIRNTLPMNVVCTVEGCNNESLKGGERKALFNTRPGQSSLQIKIENYLGKEWTCQQTIETKPNPLAAWSFTSTDGSILDLGMHSTNEKGYLELTLYCPYWMINQTRRSLTYKAGDDNVITHEAKSSDVVLLSFRSKKEIQSKKKALLKIDDSEWSDKFSLDTVGSAGSISCKYKAYSYQKQKDDKTVQKLKVGVNITLSSFGLTKIVTFSPFYMLVNDAGFAISCRENTPEAHWTDVNPGECAPFWPLQADKKKKMIVKVKDSNEESMPFLFTESHTTLLKVNNQFGAINVEVQCTEIGTHLMFQHYKPGFASVRLINQTEKATVQYVQNGCNDVQKLFPGDTVLYTWDDPVGRRELLWSCAKEKNVKNDLLKDDISDFFFDPDTKIYWVSFLDGMQRVLLFTEDIVVAAFAQQAGELEQVDQEINLSLHGMGLSLVNNHIKREVAYLGITNSGVIWEEKKKKKYKALKMKHCVLVEAAYQQFLLECQAGNPKPRKAMEGGKLEVNFDAEKGMITMIKPHKSQIRRSFEDGVWLQYRTSPHQLQCHLKIHRLQLDNQLPGAVFPTVLAPVPPPKSVAAESVPKPFTELSILLRKREYSNVMQFKYAKVLVQEMALRVDQGFLNSMIELFSADEMSEDAQLLLFEADRENINKDIRDSIEQSSSDEQKHFYDNLHCSPLKIHLSFSLYGADGDQPGQIKSEALNLFLQSVGIVLTDIQDVIFKLGYFERLYSFYNKSQLQQELTRHYSQQAIKQMYVLVLGLDVLGNPFGVIRGLAEGIEDLFYEPYQGAIQGPEEFAEGLALGVRSLLGHAVGGAAGAVSRITGALGKGIATLTLDDDYQKKRREQLNKRPADLKEGLARGGKGLVMGVFDGVTGIVRKPVEGAKEEGVKGFFKGAGKGLVGVFTRPASGVVDFASSSFEGIKRVAELSDEVRRLRPPRFLQSDGIVRAYRHLEAEGNDVLQELDKGKYASTDSYVVHVVVTKDLKNILLVTDKRIAFVTKGEILGHWDCEWQYQWEELKEPPTQTNKGIQVLLKEKQKKSFFSSGSVGKLIPIEDKNTALHIVTKMQETMSRQK